MDNSQPHHFFISYKRSEGEPYIEMLKEELSELRVPFWQDVERIKFGKAWSPEIDVGVDAAVALLLVVTPGTVNSPWITYEWSRAMGLGIPVIPIKFLPVNNEDLHDQIKKLMVADYTSDKNKIWGKLREVLLNTIMEFPSIRAEYLLSQIRNTARPVDIREKSLRLLGDYASAMVIDELLKIMRDPEHKEIIAHVAVKLGDLGDPKVIPDLLELAASNHIVNSHMAILALNRLGDPTVAPYLQQYLDHEDLWMRRMSADAMGIFKHTDAIDKLIDLLLYDPEYFVRMTAAEALGKLGDIRAVKPLCLATKDSHVHVRQDAIEALGVLRDVEAVPYLIDALQDTALYYSNHRICDTAAKSLFGIRSDEGRRAVLIWEKKQPKKKIRR